MSFYIKIWPHAGAQPGGHLGHLPPPKFSKHSIAILTFVDFKNIKMKLYILIILKKTYWNFSLSCS